MITVKIAYFFIVSILFCVLSGCKASSPEPKPPLSFPIKVDKAGQKIVFDFWVNPDDSYEKNTLMVGLAVKGDEKKIDMRQLKNANFIFKINVKQLNKAGPNVVDVKYFDSFNFDEMKTKTNTNGVAVYGEYFSSHTFFLASIGRNDSGLFRAEVEVLQGNSALNNLSFELFVDYRLYGGK
ncbi:hypothetical protein ACFQNF_03890 [Iodobacter arcticus]|uniref:Lipoprotein n=1 Tax=Iodobacter arcticus TaxID=590593 RepID=A0ABW2QTC6_9NEIS